MIESLLIASLALTSQGSVHDREQLVEVARAVMAAAGHCALVTLDDDGAPRVRTMDPFPPERDLTVWLATNAGTRKVSDLGRDPRATLYYFDAAGGGYVSLVGRAEIVDDPDQKQARWKDAWGPFYEDGNRGEDYVLIRFVPERAEIVSLEYGVASEPRAWKPAILEFPPRTDQR